MSSSKDDGSRRKASSRGYSDAGRVMSRIVADARRRHEKAVAGLREHGHEPDAGEGAWGFGTPLLSFTVRWRAPGLIRTRAVASDWDGRRSKDMDGWAWGRPYPDRGALADPGHILTTLAHAWPRLCAPFRKTDPALPGQGGRDGIDIGTGSGLPPLTILFRDGKLGTKVGQTVRMAWASESYLIAEALAALGDHFAERLPGPSAMLWQSARQIDDLPPVGPDLWPDDAPWSGEDFRDRTLRWYARKAGADPEAYRLAAVLVHARQYMFAAGKGQEPSEEDWQHPAKPWQMADLPPAAEIESMAEEAARSVDVTVEELLADAVQSACIHARHELLYKPRSEMEDAVSKAARKQDAGTGTGGLR